MWAAWRQSWDMTVGVIMARFHLLAEAGVASLPGLAYLALGFMMVLA